MSDKMKRVAVGIDLGTTFSVVAYVDENGTPRVLRNADGKPTTPSVLCFKDGEVLVGDEAKEEQALGVLDVASFFKRHMGDPTFAFSTADGRTYSAEELSTFVLRKVKKDAEVELGQEITDAVVTVPAYFDNFQRQATLNVAKSVGLNVSRILNEPTAAALAYGLKPRGTNERTWFTTSAGERSTFPLSRWTSGKFAFWRPRATIDSAVKIGTTAFCDTSRRGSPTKPGSIYTTTSSRATRPWSRPNAPNWNFRGERKRRLTSPRTAKSVLIP